MIPGGYHIPKGVRYSFYLFKIPDPDFPSFYQTIITYKTYALHRLTALWGEDAAEFKPERWLSSEFRAKLHPYQLSFPPFSSSSKKIFVG